MQRFNSYFREILIGQLLSNMNAVASGSTFKYSDDGLKVTVIPPMGVAIRNTCSAGPGERHSVGCPFTDGQNIPGYKVEIAMVDSDNSNANELTFYDVTGLNNLYWDNHDNSIGSVDIQAYRFTKLSDNSATTSNATPVAVDNTPVKKPARISRAVIGKWYSWSGNTKNMKGGIPRNLQPEDVVKYCITEDYENLESKVKRLRWNHIGSVGDIVRFCRIS